jgi:hypothetical protein
MTRWSSRSRAIRAPASRVTPGIRQRAGAGAGAEHVIGPGALGGG